MDNSPESLDNAGHPWPNASFARSLSQQGSVQSQNVLMPIPKEQQEQSASATRKRRASRSPERLYLSPANLSIRKRRAMRNAGLSNPLEILALAASSRQYAATPTSVETAGRRIILLNPPFPSPLIQRKKFDFFAALMSHVDVLLNICSYLPPQTLLNLYSISAPFHYVMDSHFSTFILESTRTYAPGAEQIFPWWCYRQLCMEDPALRRVKNPIDKRSLSWTDKQGKPHQSVAKALEASRVGAQQQPGARKASQEHVKLAVAVKAIPSFRWLKMVAYRESVSREIIGWMAAHGHRIPKYHGVEAVKKMWFIMDMPVNAPRIALIHNTAYFTANNLFLLQMFFIKLDMLYQDPIHYWGGEWCMREFLLAERSLTTLWDYLRAADGTSRLDIMRLWIKHGYRRPQPARPMTQDEQTEHDVKQKLPIMGVPAALVGRWGYECWGLGKARLMRPDELVLREGVRRRLDLQRFYLRMIAAGYLDDKLQPRPTPEPDEVVPSLIRRRKNREMAERKMQMQANETSSPRSRGHMNEAMGDSGQDESADVPAESIDELQKLVLASLGGQP